MKVFVSVGTHEKGFDRLISIVSQIRHHEVVVQFGSSKFKLPSLVNFKSFEFCSFEEMTKHAKRSDVIIGSASPGLANLAWENDCVYVGVPRLHQFNEAVDDHQLDFLKYMSELGGCVQINLDEDPDYFLERIQSEIDLLLGQQRVCQDIFNRRMSSVQQSVSNFFFQ